MPTGALMQLAKPDCCTVPHWEHLCEQAEVHQMEVWTPWLRPLIKLLARTKKNAVRSSFPCKTRWSWWRGLLQIDLIQTLVAGRRTGACTWCTIWLEGWPILLEARGYLSSGDSTPSAFFLFLSASLLPSAIFFLVRNRCVFLGLPPSLTSAGTQPWQRRLT